MEALDNSSAADRRSVLNRLKTLSQDEDLSLDKALEMGAEIKRIFAQQGGVDILRHYVKILLRLGDNEGAREIYRLILVCEPQDIPAILFESAERERSGDIAGAEDLISRIRPEEAPLTVLMRSANLKFQMGNVRGSEEVTAMALDRFPDNVYPYRFALSRAATQAEFSGLARKAAHLALERGLEDPSVALQLFRILRTTSGAEADLAKAKGHFTKCIVGKPDADVWRARLLKLNGKIAEAEAVLVAYLNKNPEDASAVQELGPLVITSGNWGAGAKIIRQYRDLPGHNDQALSRIRLVEDLFKEFGTSLDEASNEPGRFSHITTPGAVMRLIAGRPAVDQGATDRRGVVMISGSLACGGSEHIMAQTYRRFRKSDVLGGAELWLFDTEKEGSLFYLPQTGAPRSEIVQLKNTREPEAPIRYFPPFMANMTQAIYDRLMVSRPQVVHAWLDMANLCAAAAAILAGVPRIVLHAQNMWPAGLIQKSGSCFGWAECYRVLLEREEVVLINCANVAVSDYLDKAGSSRRERTRTIYNGIDLSHFASLPSQSERAAMRSEYGIPNNAQLVGAVFRFVPVKRPLRWLDAARIIHDVRPDVHFLLLGGGQLHADARAHAERLGLSDVVHMPGRVPEVYKALSLLDLFVLSSSSEGLPTVLIEAQAAGIPVVAYDVGGVAEAMHPDTTGILVREDSSEALANAVLGALADPAWMASASRLGQHLVKSKFDEKVTVGLLEEVVGGPSGVLDEKGQGRQAFLRRLLGIFR